MRRTKICREGVFYLLVIALVFFAAILREVNPLLLFGALLACPVFLAWKMERSSIHGIRVRRKKPTHVVAGEVFHVSVELVNPRKRFSGWAIIVEDTIRLLRNRDFSAAAKGDSPGDSGLLIHSESRLLRPAVYFEYIKPGGSLKKSYSGCLPRRGKYELGPLVMSTRFPIGFFRTTVQMENRGDSASEFLVYPRWGKLSSQWFSKQHQSDENLQRRRFRSSRLSGEFLGVRHWQSGDVKKWIHWRASAKHNDLVVRQYEQHQNRDAAVVLDLYQPQAPGLKELECVELAVSFAATLINELAKRSGSTLLFGTVLPPENENGNEKSAKPSRKSSSGNRKFDRIQKDRSDLMKGQICTPLIEGMMERLALIEPSPEDGLAELLLQVLSNSDQNADIFLVSPNPVDFGDSKRFHSLQNDPRLRTLSQRIRVVDTSSEEMEKIFTFE